MFTSNHYCTTTTARHGGRGWGGGFIRAKPYCLVDCKYNKFSKNAFLFLFEAPEPFFRSLYT